MSEMVFTRVEPTVKEALEKFAESDDRNSSYVVRMAIIKLLKEQGFLPEDFGAKKSIEKKAKK